MAYAPIALTMPQYEDYANWYLKAYTQGTTTPLSMATDSGGGTTLVKSEIDANGFPTTDGSARFIPYINGAYDLWMFPTSAEADANDTTNAIQLADNINADPASAITVTTVSYATNIVALIAIDGTVESRVSVSGYHSAGDGGSGMFYWDASQDKANHNGGTIIDPDITFPSDWTNQTQVTTWFTAGSGTGCWVRMTGGELNAKWFGAKGDGTTTETIPFNTIVAYVNSIGTNGAYTGDGFKIRIPRGEYYLPVGLNAVTVDGVQWVGDGRDATMIYGEAGDIFPIGDDNLTVESCSIQSMSFVVKAATTPNSNLTVCKLLHCTRITLRDLKIIRVPKLVQITASSGKAVTNILISDVVGQHYNCGVPLIGIAALNGGVGAGLYLHNIRTNLDGVGYPSEKDGTETHASLPGSDVFRFSGGLWDTIVASDCVFNRYYRGISVEATIPGTGFTNTYWNNIVIDLTHSPIHLHANGGNITKFIWSQGWLNGTDGNTVTLQRTSGLFDTISIKDTDFMNAGLSNVVIGGGTTNVHIKDNRFYASGRLQMTTASPIPKTNTSISVGSGCDGLIIDNNRWFDPILIYGSGGPFGVASGDYDPGTAISMDSIAMNFQLTNNIVRSTTTNYGGTGLTTALLFATTNTKPRILRGNAAADNAPIEYLGGSLAALPGSGSGNPVTNLSGCPMEVYLSGGTLTNIVVNGVSLGATTPIAFTLNHGESFYVTYTVAPTMIRRLLN